MTLVNPETEKWKHHLAKQKQKIIYTDKPLH